MEKKIKLTQEQADGIKIIMNGSTKKLLGSYFNNKGFISPKFLPLNTLAVVELMTCLFVPDSYEVIPQYKAEEWLFISKEATHTGKDEIRKIAGVQNGTIKFEDNWYIGIHSEYIRLATPEEIQKEKKRRFWDKLGREVDGWKEGDIVRDIREYYMTTIDNDEIENGYVYFRSGLTEVPIDEIRLVVPVEQRLDK